MDASLGHISIDTASDMLHLQETSRMEWYPFIRCSLPISTTIHHKLYTNIRSFSSTRHKLVRNFCENIWSSVWVKRQKRQAMPFWSERLKTKRFRPKAELSVSACWGISPNPMERRFYLRRRTCRRLFFFLLTFSLRFRFCIINSKQTGQICLIRHQFAALVLCFVVFRVSRLFCR